MPRNLDSDSIAALTSNSIRVAFFAELTFKSQTCYVWSGVGNYTWNSQTWSGLGSLCQITGFQEGTELQANGITLTLSGFDATLFGESMTDVQLGAPAVVYFGLLDDSMNVIGTPTVFYGGLVDKPTGEVSATTATISLALESNAIRLQQGQKLTYTSADQRRLYPDDTGFAWVESLNDQALVWQ